MFAAVSVFPYRFRHTALDHAIAMNMDNETAKKAWLEKLNQPFGFGLADHEDNKDDNIEVDLEFPIENLSKEIESNQVEKNEEDSAKQAWFDMLNREVKYRDAKVAKQAWLSSLQKPVVHSGEELAKQTWFAKFKKAAQSESENEK